MFRVIHVDKLYRRRLPNYFFEFGMTVMLGLMLVIVALSVLSFCFFLSVFILFQEATSFRSSTDVGLRLDEIDAV